MIGKIRRGWRLTLVLARIAVVWVEVALLRLEFMRLWRKLGRRELANREAGQRRVGVLANLRPYENIWR